MLTAARRAALAFAALAWFAAPARADPAPPPAGTADAAREVRAMHEAIRRKLEAFAASRQTKGGSAAKPAPRSAVGDAAKPAAAVAASNAASGPVRARVASPTVKAGIAGLSLAASKLSPSAAHPGLTPLGGAASADPRKSGGLSGLAVEHRW